MCGRYSGLPDGQVASGGSSGIIQVSSGGSQAVFTTEMPLFLTVLSVTVMFTVSPSTAVIDYQCFALFSKTQASAFLSSGKRSTPAACCHEDHCEERKSQCYTEQYRDFIIQSRGFTCPQGQAVAVTSWCPDHYAYECKDICSALGVDRCENGGSCIPVGSSWRCDCRPGYSGAICQEDISECSSSPCDATTSTGCDDRINDYFCHCKAGYTGKRCQMEIDECSSSPCQNSGTCVDHIARYSCVCAPGFTGNQCEVDINECASSPCKNNATCYDKVNRYTCDCPPRFYGVTCDTNICHPTPADVVFVLDSSVSMTASQFHKQLEFVANFTDHVTIGPRDFQVSVITFSFEATIEFYLNEYTDNVTLKDAIMNITYKPGATFTDKGLNMVQDVFSPGHGGDNPRANNTLSTRIVFLLTDGLSTDRQSTKDAARELKKVVDRIAVIGIGDQLSHQELLDIASRGDGSTTNTANVYSVDNFNSLYTVVKQLVHYDCDECAHSSTSDVSILIDKSYYISEDQYQSSINAVQHLIQLLDLGLNKSHASVTSFDKSITEIIGFRDRVFKKAEILAILNREMKCEDKQQFEISDVLNYYLKHILLIARQNARQFLLVFTNGRFKINDVMLGHAVSTLESNNVTTIAIGSGSDVNVTGLQTLVTDRYNLFLTDDKTTSLDALKSQFVYDTCDLKEK